MNRPINHHIIESCLSELLRPGMVAWNLGANDACFALRMGQLVGSEGTVYAFEPSSKHYHALKCTITAYGLERVIKPNQLAMLTYNGRSHLTPSETLHVDRLSGTNKSDNNTTEQATSWNVDDLVFEQGFAAPDLLKFDLAGSETAAVAGMQRVLSTQRPTMIIAVREESARVIASLLAPYHYLMRHLNDRSEGKKSGLTHLIFEPDTQVAARLGV